MDMMENDDKIINRFFQDNLKEIPDSGFTERVMRHLPARRGQLWSSLWTILCTLAGLILFFVWDGLASLREIIVNTAGDLVGYLISITSVRFSPLLVVMVLLTFAAVAVFQFYQSEWE